MSQTAPIFELDDFENQPHDKPVASAVLLPEPLLGDDLVRQVRQGDRRKNNLRAAFYSLFKRRRQAYSRREHEKDLHGYVDVHEPKLYYMAVTACFLSVCDAFLTLQLLQLGSQELNPLLEYFLAVDVRLFFISKFLMTAFCILFLVMHNKLKLLNRISGVQILGATILGYSILVMYELSMLASVFLG